ncbi:MAG: thiol reductant ABC exporter subunit CydC, partial [Candidatus Nanopelagicales bacterium]
AVMGFLTPSRGIVLLAGRPLVDGARWRRSLAYVGQNPGMISGTVADNVRLGHPGATDADVRQALDRVGAAGLRLEQRVGDEAEGISAGERRRIAVARALLRVSLGGARLLVLDEPTAGLDADTEAGLLATLRDVGAAALLVSHRPAVLAEADRVVELGEAPAESRGAADRRTATSEPQPGTTSAAGSRAAHCPEPPAGSGSAESAAIDGGIATDGSLRSLIEAVPGAWRRLGLALVLAFAATGASVALMAVSAWLLSRAAEHPPVLYLQVAALAVRFFGISRGAFRYLERLVGHDIALRLQSALRLETYTRLARTTLLGQRRGDLLSRVIADVEAIQDLVVRVWIPFVSSALVLLATSAAFAFFSPAAAAVLLVTSTLAGLVVPWLASRVSARADAAALPLRGELSDRVHEIARAAADLTAYGADNAHLDRFTAVDERLRRASASSAWVRGIANAGQVLAAGTAVMAGLVIGGHQVRQGSLAPVMLAVLALTPLALHEALSTLTQSAQTSTRARASLNRVREVLDADPVGSGDRDQVAGAVAVPALAVTDLAVGWPGGPVVVAAVNLHIGPGEKVALVGPSGVGKTTVAGTLLGLIPARHGHLDVQGRVGYLAQDAHIFTTSIAENVKIGNRDASPAQISEALQRAGLTLDPARVVGEAGETLSGGEARRVALARLFVGDYQVLILDEPTEHLDALTAAALIDDIWATTTDKPVLVITHDPELVARCDRSVVLARASVPAASAVATA